MKVLITGVTGFVGSHLAEYILRKPIEVYGLKRWRSPLDNISHLKEIKLYDCDLTDLSAVISVLKEIKPDRIYHLASQSYVPYSYSNPITTLNTNVIGTANLLEAIRILGQNPLIHICSSSEVYGQPEYTPIDERHPLNPISPYGVSKLAEDRLGYTYFKAYDMNIVITRMFTHTGPRRGDVFASSNFAKQIVRIEKGLQSVVYVGNLESIRTFCDVRDAVKAYWLLSPFMKGQVYNIGGTDTLTIREMLDKLCSFSTKSISYEVDPTRFRPSDVTLQIPDSSKFMRVTGWKPEIKVDKTLEDLLNYWREHD